MVSPFSIMFISPINQLLFSFLYSNSITFLPSGIFNGLNSLSDLIVSSFIWVSFLQHSFLGALCKQTYVSPFWCFQWTQQSGWSWPHTKSSFHVHTFPSNLSCSLNLNELTSIHPDTFKDLTLLKSFFQSFFIFSILHNNDSSWKLIGITPSINLRQSQKSWFISSSYSLFIILFSSLSSRVSVPTNSLPFFQASSITISISNSFLSSFHSFIMLLLFFYPELQQSVFHPIWGF